MRGGSVPEIEALIFDVDGTLAETEEVHRRAFNAAFDHHGLDFVWEPDRYRELLKVTGGKRRIERFFREEGLPDDSELASRLHADKNRTFARLLASGVEPRPGVRDLILLAKAAGLKLGIATTTSRENLLAVLAALALPAFDVVVSGGDVAALKPDPEAYTLALERLGVAPSGALAFEDSANGLAAALAAGIPTVVTPAIYTRDHDFTGAALQLATLEGFHWARWREPLRSARPISL
jgi:HAD superfamily hydrolase (TIGR01509 family)